MWTRVSTEQRWRRCAAPFSFYNDLIAKYWAGGPSEAYGASIHRICTLARKMGVKSLVVEDALARVDVIAEIDHLEEWAEVGDGEVTARTITFLSSGVRRGNDFAGVSTANVIGQMTIITFPMAKGPRSYVYEAIIRLPGKNAGAEQLLNNHISIIGDLKIALGTFEHVISGSYFCQQNGVTSICGHCAVRMLIRTLTQSVVSVQMLNQIWTYDPHTRSISTNQVVAALRHFGMMPVLYDLTQKSVDREDGWDIPALLADSASATLLVLGGKSVDHIVPLLGHTVNSDEWHPIGATLHRHGEETASSSSLWTDHLVIHDDMLGPYYCLSKAGLLHSGLANLVPKLVITVLPLNVLVSPSQAENFARQILCNLIKKLKPLNMAEGRWWQHLLDGRERRVFRTTLITRDAYLANLPANDDDDDLIKDQLATCLPERMWMSEISVPNLFLANRAKLGEILISPGAFPDDDPDKILEAMVGFRLPSVIGWAEAGDEGIVHSVTPWHERTYRRIFAPRQHSNWW